MNVVFAERPGSSNELMWKTLISKSMPDNQLIAFELPEHEISSVFAPLRLLAPTRTAQYSLANTEIESFFMVELPSEETDVEIARELCDQRLSSLFQAIPDAAVIDKRLDRIRPRISESRTPFADGENVQIIVVPRTNRPGLRFSRDENVLRVTNNRIDVIVNPDVLTDNFRWDLMKKTVTSLDEESKEKRIKKTNLYECLQRFCEDEILDDENKAFCRHCRDFFRAHKQMTLWTVPRILIIHLKRFFSKGMYQRKLDINCEYDEYLNLEGRVEVCDGVDKLNYRLVGVIGHSGGLTGGHYIADVWHRESERWICFNDEKWKKLKSNEIHSQNAYVLFYERL
jgi:hypothetical protein